MASEVAIMFRARKRLTVDRRGIRRVDRRDRAARRVAHEKPVIVVEAGELADFQRHRC